MEHYFVSTERQHLIIHLMLNEYRAKAGRQRETPPAMAGRRCAPRSPESRRFGIGIGLHGRRSRAIANLKFEISDEEEIRTEHSGSPRGLKPLLSQGLMSELKLRPPENQQHPIGKDDILFSAAGPQSAKRCRAAANRARSATTKAAPCRQRRRFYAPQGRSRTRPVGKDESAMKQFCGSNV